MQRRFAEAIMYFDPLEYHPDIFEAFDSELVRFNSFSVLVRDLRLFRISCAQ